MKLYVLFDLDDPFFLFPTGALCRRLVLELDFSSFSFVLYQHIVSESVSNLQLRVANNFKYKRATIAIINSETQGIYALSE